MRIKRLIAIALSAVAGLIVAVMLFFLMSKLVSGKHELFHFSIQTPILVDLPDCPAQKQLEFDIESEIRNSRACEADADCELLYTGCPFGCDVAVNKSGHERISPAVKAYRQYVNDNECERCLSDCPVRDAKAVCENKLCKRVEASVSAGG